MASLKDDDGPRGVGVTADGLVKASVGGDGLLEGVAVGARAMRFESHVLAGHLVTAIRQAQSDRLEQVAHAEVEKEAEAKALADALNARLDEFESRHDREFTLISAALDETLRKLEGR